MSEINKTIFLKAVMIKNEGCLLLTFFLNIQNTDLFVEVKRFFHKHFLLSQINNVIFVFMLFHFFILF